MEGCKHVALESCSSHFFVKYVLIPKTLLRERGFRLGFVYRCVVRRGRVCTS